MLLMMKCISKIKFIILKNLQDQDFQEKEMKKNWPLKIKLILLRKDNGLLMPLRVEYIDKLNSLAYY